MAAQTSDLHGRYASALFSLAEDGGFLDAVESDLQALREMLAGSGELRALIRSPLFRRAEQSAALRAIAMESGFSDLTVRFLGLVAQKRRLFALVGMIDSFDALMDRRRGRTRVEVVAAEVLDDEQASALADALRTSTGGDVVVDARTDAGLIGGLVVRIGSRMIDTSIRSRIERMRLLMREAG